jgi:predicted dehydrogenase
MEQIPDDMRLVALATAHEETARIAQEFYRVPCHVGYEALIADSNVEAVINASSPDHETVAIASLSAGKPVFNETPAIRTVAGAGRIRQLSAERKLTYLVGSCLRYAPIYQKVRALLRNWREEAPGARTYNASYYFASSHFHNLMLFLGGRISAVLSLPAPEGAGSITLLRFANGDIGSIRDCGFLNWTPPYEQMEIVHQSGMLVAEDGRVIRFHRTPQARAVHPTELAFEHAEGEFFQTTFSIPYGRNRQLYLRGYVPELAEFVHCVRTGAPPTCGVDDALATLMVGEAARRSRELGGQWADVHDS